MIPKIEKKIKAFKIKQIDKPVHFARPNTFISIIRITCFPVKEISPFPYLLRTYPANAMSKLINSRHGLNKPKKDPKQE